ncbi:DUF763 domain-containing protein [Taibaiella lutea]|uniref:DUF763 domain-containing protein n=1 Tax=Taibaiella lutea TaxID=2608001 RepID=A0A5M6CAV8_9BACT|nr:DUF763 domain-containing protein [Taibaiella lutea]KAA5532307.1 DUF763 domain-containing protein [Taibaiella lutea]
MSKKGYADMPLHYGKVPQWLASRMSMLGGAIVEAIVMEYGRGMLLRKISDPFWFQSLGCVLGMDWHSSGITTSVMGALKHSVNKKADTLGVYICGGRGRYSRETPKELTDIGYKTGIDAQRMIYNSRLSAKVDNTAIQDGFNLYLHSFIVTTDNEWCVIQQGMNTDTRVARRYHWHSPAVHSFTEQPHSFIYGKNQGEILNLTDKSAAITKQGILQLTKEDPKYLLAEIPALIMPSHHDVREKDVNIKRLGAALALAQEKGVNDMESLLLLEGVGPRTIQSLALVSEVIHGTPSRFKDPARFSFAHGGKDGHPFPVPEKVYDETIAVLQKSIEKAKLGNTDKTEALMKLHVTAKNIEKDFTPNNRFDELIKEERDNSWKYGGRTVYGRAVKPESTVKQLNLFS